MMDIKKTSVSVLQWRDTKEFLLTVDDFGVTYTGEEHGSHLLKTLQNHYEGTMIGLVQDTLALL